MKNTFIVVMKIMHTLIVQQHCIVNHKHKLIAKIMFNKVNNLFTY